MIRSNLNDSIETLWYRGRLSVHGDDASSRIHNSKPISVFLLLPYSRLEEMSSTVFVKADVDDCV